MNSPLNSVFKGQKISTIESLASTPIILDGTIEVVNVDATSGNVIVNLPLISSAPGIPLTIRKTDASGHTVTVTAAGADTIQGAATVVLSSQWNAVSIYNDGTIWYQTAGASGGGTAITSLTADVVATGPGAASATISNSAVSLAKMANLAANSIIGNNTGSSATPLALTTAQVKTLLAYYTSGDSPSFNTLTLSTALAIGQGGTGQITANAAFNALAPSQASASGKFLTSNGTDTSWATIATGPTGSGANTQVATWSGASTLTGTSTFLWTSNHLLIGTATDNTTNIVQIVDASTTSPPVQLAVKNTNANGAAGIRYATASGDWYTYSSASNPPAWKIDNSGTNYFQLYPDGAGNPNFTFTGGVAWARRHAVADTNYSINGSSTDYLIAFTSLTAARTTTLPGAAGVGPGQMIIVKDESGNCSATNTITILTSSGNTIDGQSSHVLNTPYACVTLYANSAQWFVKHLGTQLASSTLSGLVSPSAQTFGGAKTTSQWIAEASGGGSIFWRDTAAGANLKLWQSTVDTTHNALSFYPTNDANNSILTWPLAMFRSGRVAIGSTSSTSPTDDTINSLQIQGATRSQGNLTVGSYLNAGANANLAINPGRQPYSWPLEVWSGTTQTDGAAKTTILCINNDTAYTAGPEAGMSFFGLINGTSGWVSFAAISGAKENATLNDHAGFLRFCTSTSGAGSETEAMRINSSQRLLIGTTTDNGTDKVQINGSLSISTPLKIVNGGTGQSAPYGIFASRPVASSSGRVYVASDSPTALWVDDGAAWHPLICGQVVGTQPKAAANFTNFGSGSPSATLVDRNGTLNYSWANAAVGGSTVQGFFESLSSSTAHVEAVLNPDGPIPTANTGSVDWGVFMRESGTGKMISFTISMVNNGAPYGQEYEAIQWTNSTTRTGGGSFSSMMITSSLPQFLKLVRSGSNILCQYSTDGQNWTTYHTYVTATVFTTAPDQVGVLGIQWAANDALGFNVLHYLSGT